MLLHLSVILFTGGCLPQCMLGYTPLQADTPRADTPWADTPWTDTPRQTPPWQTPHPPSQQTATAADGTHPTRMHSCLLINFTANIFINLIFR